MVEQNDKWEYNEDVKFCLIGEKRMGSAEPKKLALLRILEILKEHSDCMHPLTQDNIASILEKEYGIELERKAISRNISLLKEAGYEIESNSQGSYLDERPFEDAELRLLIDGVLASKYITAKHSADLIKKLCAQSNKYFKSHVKNVQSVKEWSKTENQSLFLNIEQIDTAIEQKKQITFDYNMYGIDKKLHKSSVQQVSPYQFILHNQKYYVMTYNEYWKKINFYRVDHITNVEICEENQTPIRSIEGFENGINYSDYVSSLPYMFVDGFEQIEFIAKRWMIDHIIGWFGEKAKLENYGDEEVKATVIASPKAMEYWAVQYLDGVEILSPIKLRNRIKRDLGNGLEKYK